jgi:chromosomal replication initiator protein
VSTRFDAPIVGVRLRGASAELEVALLRSALICSDLPTPENRERLPPLPAARSRPFAPTSVEHPLWCSVVEAARHKLSFARVDAMLRDLRFVRVLERSVRAGLAPSRLEAWGQSGIIAVLDATVTEISDGALDLALVPVPADWNASLGDPAHAMDRFVVGPANQDARDAAVSVGQGSPLRPGLLILHGPPGAGKTHLLEAIGQLLAARDGETRVLEVTASELSLELVAAIRDHELDGFRERHRSADALLVDDLHRLAGRSASQQELGRSIDSLLDRGAPVVLTSAVALEELLDFAPALRRRFGCAHVLALREPDWETRVAIVSDRLRRWNLQADEAAVAFVTRLGSNLTGLDAALTRLLGNPLCTRGSIDADLVRDALEPRHPRAGRVPAEAVVSLVVRHFTLRPRELRSATRSPRVTIPRQIVMYLLRRHCGLSYPEIGQRFGRHHTTALHSVRQVARQLEQNGSLRATVRLLEKELVRSVEESG